MTPTRWHRFLQILDGMCSISLFPDPRFKIPDRTPEEAIAESWEAVGESMRKVLGDLEATIRKENKHGPHLRANPRTRGDVE